MSNNDRLNFKTSKRIKILIGFITVLLIVLMFPKGESIESEVNVGNIWIHDDLIAPFSFPVIKDPEVYNKELKEAEESVYPVFIKQADHFTTNKDSILKYNDYLLRTIDSSLNENNSQNINPTFLSAQSFSTLKNFRTQERNFLLTNGMNINNFFSVSKNILNEIYRLGVISFPKEMKLRDSIAVRTGNVDEIEPLDDFLTAEDAIKKTKDITKNLGYPPNIESALNEYLEHFIYPNLIYSRQLTDELINQAQNNVSRTSGIVTENERIVAKHDRITKETKLKIDSYKEAKGEKIGVGGLYLQMFGKFLHISFLLSLLTIYIFLFRKKIFHNNQKIILIAIMVLFFSFVTYLINQIIIPTPVYLLIFIPAASMLLTITFDSRIGFYSTVIISLIAGALRGNDYTFSALNIFAGALAVYSVRDIKNRSQIFRSFLFILLGYTIGIIAFGLERFAEADKMLVEFAFVSSNALISPVLTYGLLIFFEKSFKITTDLTLLELSNFDGPLLKELSRKAPGTFNHSMTMGTLAEAAAERIGANPLLARVGAYYHDIGKTIMPQNFVENQLNRQNVHEGLTPEESVSLIVKHVKEGIELAKENNLPQEIIDFIPAHHGTMVMSFFYEKAKTLYGEEKVNVEEYKYPGPKPNTKETAIIMLADGCESAVRSIEDPDPIKVENVIDKIIQTRIDDGQLDDSPITFSDITKIKEAFISILLGQHHRRIRYPKQDEMEKGIEEKKGTEEKKENA
ncbi:MAG: HDIG domain-containing metalloprotein [Ignavibacteriaceae bacterium]